MQIVCPNQSDKLATDTITVGTEAAIEEVRRLHNEIISHARMSLEKAIRIGEILFRVREALKKQKQWLTWIEDNLPFSIHTADRYTNCFEKRHLLKFANVANLADAYALLLSPPQPNGSGPGDTQKLHEPNFHSRAVRLRQDLVALFNHHLQRRPLKAWHTEEIYDLFCSLKSVTEICTQLELELKTRDDVPESYRQTVAG